MRLLPPSANNFIRRNLLIGAVVAFTVGAALTRLTGPVPAPVHVPALLTLTLFLLTFLLRRRTAGPWLLFLSFCLTGFVHTGPALAPPSEPGHIYNIIRQKTRVTLTGILTTMPEYNGAKTRFVLAADSLMPHLQNREMVLRPVHGLVRFSLDGRLPPSIRPGDHLMVLATLNRSFTYRTPGIFDYRMHLAARDIYVTGKIKSLSRIQPFIDPDEPDRTRVRFLPQRLRLRISSFLDKTLDPDTAGLYRALLIGSRAGVSERIQEQFRATGTMHLLAISGLHMGLLGLMTTLCLTWLMKRSTTLLLHAHVPTLATLLSLVPLIGYAFIAGMNTPVFRALTMATLFLVGVVLRGQRSVLHITAAAALVVLLVKPLTLFTVSFQLSFSAVLAIALLYPRLLNLLENKKFPGGKTGRYALTGLLVSVAATLGTLPFLLLHFNRFSPIGPVMNLLIEPLLCFWALPIGLLAIPCIFIAPGLAETLLHLGSVALKGADGITRLGAQLPFATVWTITPSLVQIFFYALFLLLLLSPVPSRIRRPARAGLAMVIFWFILSPWLDTITTDTTDVTYIDVGQGSSSLVRLSSGRVILIDGGARTAPGYDVGERIIAPFLWYKQIRRIDDLIITHPDSDHYNGLFFILRRFKPRRLWVNGDGKNIRPYRQLLALARAQGVQILEPSGGDLLYSDETTELFFPAGAKRHPPGTTVNDRSLVIKLRSNRVSFLFPGDLGFGGEALVLNSGADVEADVLLAAHHGSGSSNSRKFVDAINPKFIVVSAGRSVRGPYLAREHLHNWRTAGIQVVTTADNGTVTCSTDGVKLKVESFSR